MNGGEDVGQLNSNDSVMLRKLLKSWNLESLLQLFKDEGITMDVLLMLKPHHIPRLLRNYQLGLQIRFEYHLEKWRKFIDKPLQSPTQSDSNYSCCCYGSNHHGTKREKEFKTRSVPPSYNTQNYTMPSLYCEPYLPPETLASCPKSISPSSPAPSSISSYENRLPPPKLTPAPPPPPPQPSISTTPTAVSLPASITTPTLPPTSTLTPTSSTSIVSASQTLPTFSNNFNSHTFNTTHNQRAIKNPVFSGDDYRSPHVSVNLILSVSQPKGQQLLDYYREHQCLTNSHRLQLINLIATYFDDNDYHLSLQTSYNMEREILKIFPNERLENYRTEKRGKIYVKFCNMKRYRAVREKPTSASSSSVSTSSIKRRRFGSLDGSLGVSSLMAKDDAINADDEDFTMGFENWDQPSQNNDIFIKTENIYDENYH